MDTAEPVGNKDQPATTRRRRGWILFIVLFVLAGLSLLGEIAFQSLKSKGWTTYTDAGLAGFSVNALVIDEQGRVWVGTDSGLRVLAPDGNWTTYTTANSGLADDRVYDLAIDGQGRVWVSTPVGLSVLDPDGGWTTYTPDNSALADGRVRAMAIDGQGRVWVGTFVGLSVLAPDGKWMNYTPDNSCLALAWVNALVIDQQGRVWVSTDCGLSMLDPDGKWTTYTPANSGLADDQVEAVAIDQQGRVWAGTLFGLSVLAPDGSWTTYTPANSGLADDWVLAMAFDEQGRVWLDTDDDSGLSVLDPDGNWTTYTTANSGLANDWVNAIAIDGQGRAWMSTRGGLSVLDPEVAINLGFMASLRLYLYLIAVFAPFGLANYWALQRRRLRPKKVAPASPVLQPAPIEAAMLETGSKGEQIRGQREMDSDNLNQLEMRRIKKSAQGVYSWLWLSPLLTAPTLTLLVFGGSTSIAVLGSALWHLLLLRQALAKHPYVRWHGRQGLLLAGLRTAVPLLIGLLYQEDNMLPWFLLLAFIWLAGNIWGLNQVVRGDCWLMRVFGQDEGLPLQWPDKIPAAPPAASVKPQPSVERGEVLLVEGQRQATVSELLAAFRSGDSGIRGIAIEQLKSMGEVEDF